MRAYLNDLEDAYNSIFAFLLIVESLEEKKSQNFGTGVVRIEGTRMGTIYGPYKPEDLERWMLPQDRLWLSSVVLESPGFWSFVGSLTPLETIRKYLNDRHERKKDGDYRNSLEQEQMRLENEKLMLRTVGYL